MCERKEFQVPVLLRLSCAETITDLDEFDSVHDALSKAYFFVPCDVMSAQE